MGAARKVYVKVIKEREEWLEISAVTLTEAKNLAREDMDVIRVEGAQYEEPDNEDN